MRGFPAEKSNALRARNGKIWLNALIFANCILWFWPLGAQESLGPLDSLVVFEPSLKLLADASTALEDKRISPRVCHAWGPYSEINQVQALEQKVIVEGVETDVFELKVHSAPDYLVYIGPMATPEGARRLLEELRSQEIESHFIVQGRFSDTLSVGVFSQKTRARRQQEKVAELGYEVAIEELQHSRPVYYLLLNAPADFVPVIAPNEVCNEIAPIHKFL